MVLGIGGGVNVGAATGYLFIDATGVRKGLNAAGGALDQFNRRSVAVARASAATAEAAARQAAVRSVTDATTLSKNAALQANLANQTAAATQTIAKSYDTRAKALAKAQTKEHQITTQAKADLEAQKKVVDQINADVAKAQAAFDQFKAAPVSVTTGKPLAGAAAASAIKKQEQELLKLKQDQVAAILKYEDISIAAEKAVQKEIDNTRKKVQQSIADQKKATDAVRQASAQRATELRAQAQVLGPSAQRAAEAVIASEKKILLAREELIVADNKLAAAEKKIADARSAKDLEAAQLAAAAALRERQVAAERLDALLVQQSIAEREYAAVVQKEEAKAAKAVEEAVAREAEARHAEQVARANAQQAVAQTVVNTLSVAAVGIAAVMGTAIAQFAKFEEQMRNVASISNQADLAMTTMFDHVLNLSRQTAQAPEDLAKALYDIVSSGFDGAQALDVLDASARAAVAGMSDVATSGKAITAVLNAYKGATRGAAAETLNAQQVSDKMFQSVKDGVFTFSELTQQQGDNLAIAAELGVGYDELSAAYVVLTRKGNSLAESTTQLNGIMRTFLKPNEDLAAAIKKYGEELFGIQDATGAAIIEQEGLAGALKLVEVATHGSNAELGKLFPNVRALRGEVALSGASLRFLAQEQQAIARSSGGVGATQRALAEQMKATSFQARQAAAEWRVFAIQLGQQTAGVISPLIAAIGGLGHALQGLPPELKAAGLGVAGYVAIMATGITVIGKVVGALRNFHAAMAAAQEGGTALAGVLRLVTFAFNPITLGLVGLAAATAFVIQRHREQQQRVKDLIQAYKDLDVVLKGLNRTVDFLAGEGVLTPAELERVKAYVTEIQKLPDVLQAMKQHAQDVVDLIDAQLVGLRQQQIDAAEAGAAGSSAELERSLGLQARIDALEAARKEYQRLIDDLSDPKNIDKLQGVEAAVSELFQTPNLDVEKLTADLRVLLSAFEETGNVDALVAGITALQNQQSKYNKTAAETADADSRVIAVMGNTEDAQDAQVKALADLIAKTKQAVGVTDDFSSAQARVQQALGTTGETTLQTFIRLGEAGTLAFTDTQMAALKAANAVEQTDLAVKKVEADLAKHQQTISDWQQRLNQIDQTIGTVNDNYFKLNELVRTGRLTQEQANQVLAATAQLRGEGANAAADEAAAQALDIIQLAKSVSAHDDALARYNALSDSQKSFADAIQNTTTQIELMTIAMLKLLSAMNPDAFPPELVTQFILDTSQVDPGLAELAAKLGLAPTSMIIQVRLNTDPALKDLDNLKTLRAVVLQQLSDFNKSVTGLGMTDEQRAQQKDLEQALKEVDDAIVKAQDDAKDGITMGDDGSIKQVTADTNAFLDTVQGSFTTVPEFFDDAATAQLRLREAVAQTIPDMLRQIDIFHDYANPLSVIQANLGAVGRSFAQTLRLAETSDKFGGILGNLDPTHKKLIGLVADLDKVDAKIAGVNAAIQNNNEDMQAWQNNIDFVDQTIGTAEDGYKALNQLVTEGRISQDEANKILEDAIWLRERSVGGLEDERAEQARLIPQLREYVEAHDKLWKTYQGLNPEAKGFVAAMQDQTVQMALNTTLMLSMLEQLGAIPEGVTAKWVKMAGTLNPLVASVFQDLGILGEGTDIPFKGDTSDYDQKKKHVDDENKKLKDTGVDVPVNFKAGDGTDVAAGAIAPAQTVTVTPTIDWTKLPKPPGITVRITGTDAPLKQHLKDAVATVKDFAFVAGSEYDHQFGAGMIDNTDRITEGWTNGVEPVLSLIQANARVMGNFSGVDYDNGVAEGLVANVGVVELAARYVMGSLIAAAASELRAKSPSKEGVDLGSDYAVGVALGIRSQTDQAVSAARSMGQQMVGATRGALAAAPLAIQQADAGRFAIARAISTGRGAQTTVTIAPSIAVTGGMTNDETAEIIWQRLESGLNRYAAQTGFGAN